MHFRKTCRKASKPMKLDFSRTWLHSKTTSALIERSFDHRAVNSRQCPNFLRRKPKNVLKQPPLCKRFCLSSKTFLRPVDCNLDKPAGTFLPDNPNFHAHSAKFLRKLVFLEKKFVPLVPLETMNAAPLSLPKILQNFDTVRLKTEKQFIFCNYYFYLHAFPSQV